MKNRKQIFDFVEKRNVKFINGKLTMSIFFFDLHDFYQLCKVFFAQKASENPLDAKLLDGYMAIPIGDICEFYEIDTDLLTITRTEA